MVLILAALVCQAQETADSLIEAGHWKRARALVDPRLREAPDDPDANFLSSQIHNAFGDNAAPLGLAERAVQLAPGVARYHRQVAEVQGVMAQHAGLFQQALLARRFRKEIDIALLDPRDAQARRDLLEFHLLAPGIIGGDPKKAETAAQQIAAIDAAEGFLAQARIAQFRKDPAQMEALLRRATEIHPTSYKALMALAQVYLEPGHREEGAAETLAKRAVALDPGRVGGYSILASVYAGREDWRALDAILQSAAREDPDDATPYYRAAERLLSDNHDAARAGRYLRTYLAQEPEGNQPTAADAERELRSVNATKMGGVN